MITNDINQKSYIGLAKNIESRWNQHKSFTKHDTEKNLYWAFEEFGIENFTFEVLKEAPINELGFWERKLIKEYDTYHHGYNSSPGGEGSTIKTLSDRYEINYKLFANDHLNYEDNNFEELKKQKFENKYEKKEKKYNSKILKHKSKARDKRVIRIETKKEKNLSKINVKIVHWKTLSGEIENRNKIKKKELFEPLKAQVKMSVKQYKTSPSDSFLNNVSMGAIKISRFQRDNVKYKTINIIRTFGNVKFASHKIVFSPDGSKNMSVDLEGLRKITLLAFDDCYAVSFNGAHMDFLDLESKQMGSSHKIRYPSGNVIYFYDLDSLETFVVTIRSRIGY